ncbi:MAG: murein hydrolase activator EnvC family protein [Methanocella sp.]
MSREDRLLTRIRCRGLAAVLAVAVIAMGGWSALVATPVQAEGTTESQLDDVRDRISETKDKLTEKRQQERSQLQELQAREQELEAAQNKLRRIERDLKNTNTRVADLQQQLVLAQANLRGAEKDLSGHYVRFSRRLRALYEAGPLNYLEIVFTAHSFSDLVVRAELMQRLIASDAKLFAQVQDYKARVEKEQERIRKTKKELEQRQAEIAALRKDQAAETARIQAKVKEREAVLKRIVSERKSYEAALAEEEAEAKRLESFIKGQQKRGGPSTSQAVSGSLLWPVRGRITSDFGWRVHPILKTKRYHSGLDIAVPSGTPVQATAGGKVILSGWVGGYGKTIIIDHGGGVSSLYGHNSSLLVAEGATVRAGQIITKAGSTGLSTGPHVHFEVRRDGQAVDPRPWLGR